MLATNTSAITSWLGYKSQEYRLVQRLLEADNTTCIGFEILDDVEEYSEHSLTLEQDKISVTDRNIVANQSKDLWKTLSNWVNLIRENRVDPAITTFLLYTNKPHSSEVLDLLVNAKTEDQAKAAFESILTFAKNPSENIKSYVDNFANMDEKIFTLIQNFDYIHGSGSASKDLQSTYITKRLGALEENVEEILYEILGWVGDCLVSAAEQRNLTIISTKSFGLRLANIESKYRQQTILNFMCKRTSSSKDVVEDLGLEPLYIKQLKLIEVDDTDVEEAVIAKLEAKDAIVKWAIDGHIQELSYRDYQKSIKQQWNIQKKLIQLEQGYTRSNTHIGMHIYYKCLEVTGRIELENKKLASFFSHGTLQVLADDLNIGWHPDYIVKLRGSNVNT